MKGGGYVKGGFSFCGVDIADIGLEYAPDVKDTYVYAPAKTNVHEETFEGHNGGYTYGAYKEPKLFTLRCYYEDNHIAKGLMAKVFALFRVGKQGRLIFQRRPWCYYHAVVTSVDYSEMHSYANGLITVEMKAYFPFARAEKLDPDWDDAHLFYNELTDPCHAEVMQNSAILDKECMVPSMVFTDAPTNPVLLYNPGTERAKVDIVISGEAGDGITIANRTTEQAARYVAFNSESGEIYTDGTNGKTVKTINGNTTLAFLYHDYGFIELEPAFPILRDIYATCDGNTVTTINKLYSDEDEKEWYIGKYIFLGDESQGKWCKINKCEDKHTLSLTQAGVNGSFRTSIVLMNEIHITLTQGSFINRLAFIYKPTFA